MLQQAASPWASGEGPLSKIWQEIQNTPSQEEDFPPLNGPYPLLPELVSAASTGLSQIYTLLDFFKKL